MGYIKFNKIIFDMRSNTIKAITINKKKKRSKPYIMSHITFMFTASLEFCFLNRILDKIDWKYHHA